MEKMLNMLFDYQRFENNPRIAKMIGEAESRYSRALSDDELSFLNAAGVSDSEAEKKIRKQIEDLKR